LSKKTFARAARTGNALLVRVKGNQPKLLAAIETLCARQTPVDRHATVDRARHGRQEHRRIEVFEAAGHFGAEWEPWIACAARITRLTWRKDTRSGLWTAREEVGFYVSQARLDAASFGQAVRAHWGIENRDHYVRDRILREDDSRIRRKPGIFARIRSFALNILRATGITNVSEADLHQYSLPRSPPRLQFGVKVADADGSGRAVSQLRSPAPQQGR
jgi:predicted transposase YbfD/YdcC